jgi:hypothetical protein
LGEGGCQGLSALGARVAEKHSWAITIVLLAWVLWAEAPIQNKLPLWEVLGAHETKASCERHLTSILAEMQRQGDTIHGNTIRTSRGTMFLKCLSDTIDPRRK